MPRLPKKRTTLTQEPRTAFGWTPGYPPLLTLPEPPSSNRYWRTFRGRVVKSKEARSYQQAVQVLAAGRKAIKGPIKLAVRWYRSAKRGDLSNRIKVVEDALQGVLYANDSQVEELHAYRFEEPTNPRLEVEVW
jgi:crossover junction endodeoxyribonuclease RusA